ncbi:MAG: hypothetical protein AAFO81_07435 [Pseudomonadota bacterium]
MTARLTHRSIQGHWRRVLLVVAGLLMAACGGGGGGDGVVTPTPPTPPTNSAPGVDAGTDQTVARNVVVTLAASATDPDGTAGLVYAWTQTVGTSVTLSDAGVANPTFTSPDVAATEDLVFDVTVTDSGGLSATDSVTVTVLQNAPPVALAGDDQNVEQMQAVTLAGAATDDDPIANLSFAWTQTAGASVTLNDATTANASFAAPATTGQQTLTFLLTVTDAFGATGTDEIEVRVFEDITASTLSGIIQYEAVPFVGGGLSYDDTQAKPVRGATVQLIDANDNVTVLLSTVTDDTGAYQFPTTAGANVFLRVRAELIRTGTPGWDVEVRDNTGQTNLPLDERPLYVLDSTSFTIMPGDQDLSLLALSGWTGASYGDVRAAAPFSILDTIYDGMQLVLSADPDAVFAPLDAFWSVNNTPNVSGARNLETGEIGTSFYRGDIDSLFLLGDDNTDTEEYDIFVVAHEWGHYFEDNFSRSDSIGGSHSLSQRLDPRLAFGEGFGNAVSAMINEGDVYFDTQGPQQSGGFSFSLESNGATAANRGWFSELSIQAVLYDLFDSDSDAGDNLSLGFGPIYDVLTNEQANGVPFTTIYPFIQALRTRNPGLIGDIDALLATQRIRGDADGFGVGETEDAGAPDVVLPVYTVVTPGGGSVEVCSTNLFDPDEDGNKLSVRRFVRFVAPTAGNYTVSIVTNNSPAAAVTDPDAFVFDGPNLVGGGNSAVADSETFALNNLPAGEYTMEVYEFSYLAGTPTAIAQPDDRTCFDITISN